MKIKPSFAILLCITIASFALRLYNVNQLPQILNRDEAALAYNAILLQKTGTDEWGKFWPLALESFGDYKLPGYVWALVILFKYLPEQDWVVRLPAIIAGSSLIPITYFIAQNWKLKNEQKWFATVSAAVTPVFFFYSRIAFEALLALSLWTLLFGLILWKPTKKYLAIVGDILVILLALLASFTYNTPFLLLPFLIVVIPLIRGVKNWKRWTGLCASLLVVFASAAFVLLPLTSQKSGITLFSDETTLTEFISYRESLSPVPQIVLGSKYSYLGGIMLKNFAASFAPNFMVFKGGIHPWHSLPNAGNLLLISYLLGLLGLGSILIELGKLSKSFLKKKNLKAFLNILESRQFILLFLVVSSLAPSVITVDAPHTTRSLAFLFWWMFVSVEGLVKLSELLKGVVSSLKKTSRKKKRVAPLLLAISMLLLLAEFGFFTYKYFVSYPKNQPAALQVGFDKILLEVEENYPDKEIAVVDGGGYLYIVAAWYLHLSPDEFFSSIVKQQPDQIGFRYGEKVARYHFIADPTDRKKTGETVLLNWDENTWSIESF
jgi:hypothetical protein